MAWRANKKTRLEPGKVCQETRPQPGKGHQKPGQGLVKTSAAKNWHAHCYARASTFLVQTTCSEVTKYRISNQRGLGLKFFYRLISDLAQPSGQAADVVNFALPDNHDSPANFFELQLHCPVSPNVSLKLLAPEIGPRLRLVTEAAALVPVPKAPVHQNDRLMARKDNIGFAGQASYVETKPVTKTVQPRPNRQLRLGIAPTNARHQRRTLILGKNINHSSHHQTRNPTPSPVQRSGRPELPAWHWAVLHAQQACQD